MTPHKDTQFQPLAYEADADKTLYFCGCKQTLNKPFAMAHIIPYKTFEVGT